MDAAQLAHALGAHTEHNGVYKALCPAHDDHTPSFEITDKNDKVVFICRAGCSQDAVVSALKERGLLDAKVITETGAQIKSKVVARYHYRDQYGKVLYWKERLEPGRSGKKKEFRFRHNDPTTGKDEFGHGKHNPHVFYNSPNVVKSKSVIVVEGEGLVDLLTEWGLVATTLDAGSGSRLTPEQIEQLSDKRIAILRDPDEPGLVYATNFANDLQGKCESLKVILLPGLGPKEDFKEWRCKPSNDKAALLAIIKDAPEWQPATPQDAAEVATAPKPIAFPLKSGRDLRALDIKTEWLIDGLIPRYSVVLLYGRGGIGKTTLIMMCADAIDRAMSIFGMTTVKTQVIVIDFENSLAVLSERAKRTAVDGVLFWNSGDNPPSLDKADWTAYQELLEQYPGAVFIFDTLRSAHSGDENNSEVMTIIMRRMRMLRDAGATVILLHHTPKGNDRQFKGSGAIFDLCDQTLALYQTAKPGSDQEATDDDDDQDKVYRFGTGKKTRYRPHRVFLSFDAEKEVFTLAKNPEDEALEILHAIICKIDARTSAIQTEIVKTAMEDGGCDFGSDKKIRALLKRGIDRFWTTGRGINNSIIYHPIRFGGLADPIGEEKPPNRNHAACQSGNTPEKPALPHNQQSTINKGFGGLATGKIQTEKHLDIEDADFQEIPTFTEADFSAEVLS